MSSEERKVLRSSQQSATEKVDVRRGVGVRASAWMVIGVF